MFTLVDNKRGRVIKFFLENPTEEIHLRGLSRKLKISPTWIAKTARSLTKFGLLVRRDRDKTTTIKADRENPSFRRLKISSNLYNLHNSGFLDELVKVYNKPESIILFGSYGRGEDTEESDIDIAVITVGNKQRDWAKFEKRLNRKIRIIELKKELIELDFMNTLANGIVLYGYLEVK